MKINRYKEARISLYILAALLSFSLLFYFVASMFTSVGYEGLRKAKSANSEPNLINELPTVIIDAGHGGEDPGAVANGLNEKELNLATAKIINEMFVAFGYKTHMTRTEDVLLYNDGEENRKKFFDLKNRQTIAESFENAVFVSVHMNKFPAEYCKGLQTFYSENNENSYILAESIQNSAYLLQTDNKRVIKAGNETIYLLENLKMPAVLIECGFISNNEEAVLLSNNEYRTKLSLCIFCGISEYLKGA